MNATANAEDVDDRLARIARAVLYEGYILWPYRRSALKNRQRWTFGAVLPRAWVAPDHPDDACVMQAETLLEVSSGVLPEIDVTVRCLHMVERRVARREGDRLAPVEELTVGDERWLPWDEAAEREFAIRHFRLGGVRSAITAAEVAAASSREWVRNAGGAATGALLRTWRELNGHVQVSHEPLGSAVHRVRVSLSNESRLPPDASRDDALRQSYLSTHIVLRARGGAFVSQTDPPSALTALVQTCSSVGCWPVLVGAPGRRDTVLAAPIILSEYPEIAPESPGDLFDGGEIDELLALNILALSGAEREEMCATDPRARAILERTLALTPADLLRLHGRRQDGPTP